MKSPTDLNEALHTANDAAERASFIKSAAQPPVRTNFDGPYRAFDLCERMRYEHGRVKPVQVMRMGAWRWGPFAGGTVHWGDEIYRVWATPWFAFWWRTGTVPAKDSR